MKENFKRLLLKLKFKSKVRLAKGTNITLSSSFEGANYIGIGSSFDGVLGYGSYIGNSSQLSARIGRYCSIASHVVTVNGFHPTSVFASTHPSFYALKNCLGLSYTTQQLFDEFRYALPDEERDVSIGNDVWIGYGVIILAGITIGDGSIIGAGAVVTKDVPPYSIVAGNPAKIIRTRFSNDKVSALLAEPWWLKSPDWIRKHSDAFTDIDMLISILNSSA